MRLILLGPPGSGKGTQTHLLKKLNFKVISVGKILRKESKQKTKIGKLINKVISKGKLVPDTLANRIIKKRVKKYKGNFVVDGYPRDLVEAKFIYNLVKIDKVFFLDANKKILINRLNNRYKLLKRGDDKPEVIKKRFKVYEKETVPAINYFKKKKLLIKINANKTINEIFKEIKPHLK